ncbi:MAG: hypothetical protein GY717_18795 [Rhodobacteraceae bacterium]|nr:hypothetical protein [Paracoccaceae bacterium]
MFDELRPYLAYLSGTPEPARDGLAALRHMADVPVAAAEPDALGMARLRALGFGFGFGDAGPGNAWRWAVEDWLLSALMRPGPSQAFAAANAQRRPGPAPLPCWR